jgi:hypothetical protein
MLREIEGPKWGFPQGGGGVPGFLGEEKEKKTEKGTAEQGIESARPLDLVHALIVRREMEIICKLLQWGK